MFTHFVKEHNDIDRIVSYADRRWSSVDAFYPKLGFEKISSTHPNFYYIVDGVRENRMKYQKHKLILAEAEQGMSEHEIMKSRGIMRIYDCGNWKYEWKRP